MAGKTAATETAPCSSIDPLGQKIDRRSFVNQTMRRVGRLALRQAPVLTRARSCMVAMHPAALMKSEIECL
jgi:hypothetical protein